MDLCGIPALRKTPDRVGSPFIEWVANVPAAFVYASTGSFMS